MEMAEPIKLGDESLKQETNRENNNQLANSAESTVTDTENPKALSSEMSLHDAEAPSTRVVAEPAEEPVPSNNSSPLSPSDNPGNPMLGSEGLKSNEKDNGKDGGDALTDVSADDESPENDGPLTGGTETPIAIVSSSKKSRPQYKYDPDKITLRFLFANRDGLAVTVECKPGDTIGEVKGALLSVWPEGKCTVQ